MYKSLCLCNIPERQALLSLINVPSEDINWIMEADIKDKSCWETITNVLYYYMNEIETVISKNDLDTLPDFLFSVDFYEWLTNQLQYFWFTMKSEETEFFRLLLNVLNCISYVHLNHVHEEIAETLTFHYFYSLEIYSRKADHANFYLDYYLTFLHQIINGNPNKFLQEAFICEDEFHIYDIFERVFFLDDINLTDQLLSQIQLFDLDDNIGVILINRLHSTFRNYFEDRFKLNEEEVVPPLIAESSSLYTRFLINTKISNSVLKLSCCDSLMQSFLEKVFSCVEKKQNSDYLNQIIVRSRLGMIDESSFLSQFIHYLPPDCLEESSISLIYGHVCTHKIDISEGRNEVREAILYLNEVNADCSLTSTICCVIIMMLISEYMLDEFVNIIQQNDDILISSLIGCLNIFDTDEYIEEKSPGLCANAFEALVTILEFVYCNKDDVAGIFLPILITAVADSDFESFHEFVDHIETNVGPELLGSDFMIYFGECVDEELENNTCFVPS